MTREHVEACWGSPSTIDNSESIGLKLEWGEETWECCAETDRHLANSSALISDPVRLSAGLEPL
jgi:hypothetical protein